MDIKKYINNTDVKVLSNLSGNINAVENRGAGCWLFSLYSFHILYARYELKNFKHVNNCTKILLKVFVSILDFFAKIAEIDKVTFINHSLTSTTLWKNNTNPIKNFNRNTIKKLNNAVIVRSLNKLSNNSIMQQMEKDGGKKVFFRKLTTLAPEYRLSRKHRKNINKDYRLIEKYGYHLIKKTEFTANEIKRVKQIYDMLYLDKHFHLNAEYTEDFFKASAKNDNFELLCLEKDDKIDAFILIHKLDGQMECPCIGYDTNINKKFGLYRQLIAIAIKYSQKNNYFFLLSAGSTEFKMNRGARPTNEYYMVFYRHLPFHKRFGWLLFILIKAVFQLLNQIPLWPCLKSGDFLEHWLPDGYQTLYLKEKEDRSILYIW
ncbi:MAG: GNAT family N-acetyltransferase [bacterium]|nr:GNAT family N-acetyltransferase [bacterium]